MRQIKIIFLLVLVMISSSVFAQLNPVNDLYFGGLSYQYGNYNCPEFNCYSLTWSEPDTSLTDTLVGYNLYKNNVYYKFTTETNASCEGYGTCLYLDLFVDIPYWLTVKAVYNSDSIISIANDSISIEDFAVNIEDKKLNNLFLLKNPVRLGENISLVIPENEINNCKVIKVTTQNGQIVKEYSIGEKFKGNIIYISTSKLTQGVYLISLISETNVMSSKLIIK